MRNIKYILLLFCVFHTWSIILARATEEDTDQFKDDQDNAIANVFKISREEDTFVKNPKSNCWMTLNAAHLFNVMDEIDDRYDKVRTEIHDSLMTSGFDEDMVKGFISSRGGAVREVHKYHSEWMIPSGINLGGSCMLRMPDSVLFFHRMKLRNNTHFHVEALHNDFTNMQVMISLCLNDLHLKGAYERSLTDNDPSVLIYAPTFGQVEFLLKKVRYRMEGRYRLIKNRLVIEIISSEIIADDIMMTYINQAIEKSAVRVEKENLGFFFSRLKIDLDQWLKDYFNDYMIHAQLDGIGDIDKLAKYDKEKGTALEEYTDKAITAIVTRIRLLNADTIRVPAFTFKSIHGLQIKLYDGVLRGLDSMYRRSVATGVKQKDVRKVDTIVGFSNLKVVYKYEAVLPTGVPPLAGVLTLSANELSAHMALALVKEPETVDLDIEFLDQTKPESLTVEGAANTMIANFKHLLEHQILSIMSHTLLHGIMMLKSLPSCEPFVPGQILKKNKKQDDMSSLSNSEAMSPKEDSPNDSPLSDDMTQKEDNNYDSPQNDDTSQKEGNTDDYPQNEDISQREDNTDDSPQNDDTSQKETDKDYKEVAVYSEEEKAKAALRSTKRPITNSTNKSKYQKNIKRKNKPKGKKFKSIRNKKPNQNDKPKQKN